MFTLNGRPISIDNEYTTEDGVTYPHLRDPAIREELGIIETPDPEFYDQRFYWGVDNPKQLEDEEVTPEDGQPYTQTGLKTQWIHQIKQTAGSILAQSDWCVTRLFERQIAIPEAIAAKRAAVIAEENRLEEAITDCETVEDLIAVVGAQNWPA